MSDYREREIESLLGAASGGRPADVNLAYAQVQRRVRIARRRRATVVGSAACVALVAVAALTLTRLGTEQNHSADHPSPTDSRQLRPDVSTTTSTTPESTSTTAAVVLVTTTNVATSTTLEAATSIATPPTPGATTPGHTAPAGATPTAAPTTTPAIPTSSQVPPTIATSNTQTFTGIGGRITVRLTEGSLVLVSFQPEAGFTGRVEHPSGSHVEVRFESASHVTTARVDLEDGQMRQKIEESGD